MNDVPVGPENIPLREVIKTFPVIVSIFHDDKLVREEKIDYSHYESRKWLGRTTVWALSNGYTIETRKDES